MFDEEDGEYLVSLSEEVIRFCEKLRLSIGASILRDRERWIGKVKEAANENTGIKYDWCLPVWKCGYRRAGRLF